ncbi:hypothetical protein H4R26_001015 [Coemansia thaxteri]|uniref:NudC domain-containing protein 1 n=1 Tax=Coemansia thaxteri TaxID=2663907 RepID=A0A9W8BGP2_9FUNG|nr:hypothetical protein H4R26_001015 [Coemansia thaxteri]KAJ2487513.1 hypothetical protein EV174_000491 [Coemansia sp. RSA 2320]
MAYAVLDFKPNPELLNPCFDGYKLRAADGNKAVKIYPHSSEAVKSQKLPSNAPLSYDEAYFRVHYNHLFVGPSDRTFIYIDSASVVNLVTFDQLGLPRTASIFAIPQHGSDSALAGYPGAFSLSNDLVLLFDGVESVYVIQRPPTAACSHEQWTLLGVFELGLGQLAAGPAGDSTRRMMYSILGAVLARESDRRVIRLHVCYRAVKAIEAVGEHRSGQGIGAPQSMAARDVTAPGYRHLPPFRVEALQVGLPLTDPVSAGLIGEPCQHRAPATLQACTMHTLHCYAIPVYCEYISDGAYVLGVRDGVVLDDTECASRQHSPVGPRLTEAPPCIPDLYYWSQTRSDVTMCIQLPISVTAQQIQCVLTRVALTLTFADAPECESKYAFNHAALCGGIVADESVWTLENGRLLTLYLQKVHEGARWPTLFGTDDGVLETMDPNEFAVIRERLEGHTSDTLDLRRPTGVSAMQLTNEARDQEDDELGQENASIVFSVRDWRTGQASASSVAGSPDWLCPSFPRPLSKRHGSNDGGDNAARNGLAPVCLGFDVDGAVFGFNGGDMRSVSGGRETMHADASSGTSAIAAEARPQHWGTFVALSYIQASKRERRFVYVDPDLSVAVLAESQRRIYVYHQAADMRSTTAAQSIVDLGCADAAGESEELLGIQLFGRLLVVLREGSIFTIDLDLC